MRYYTDAYRASERWGGGGRGRSQSSFKVSGADVNDEIRRLLRWIYRSAC